MGVKRVNNNYINLIIIFIISHKFYLLQIHVSIIDLVKERHQDQHHITKSYRGTKQIRNQKVRSALCLHLTSMHGWYPIYTEYTIKTNNDTEQN